MMILEMMTTNDDDYLVYVFQVVSGNMCTRWLYTTLELCRCD